MAKATGFMRFDRENPPKRPVAERLTDYNEFEKLLPGDSLQRQANRCMDCGIPFCHTFGCPVRNRIPEWIDQVYRGRWRRALDLLHATDDFPEITGRICPSPCEDACTLSIHKPPVTIRQLELQIVERGFKEGWIVPEPAPIKSGRRVAVIGSGPAGLTAAARLSRRGHEVTVFERADRIGGLLRYGIPDFKLEKWVLDRRLSHMRDEGVTFETGVEVGRDLSARYLRRSFDAVVLAMGATAPRDLPVPGRDLAGVHFAMEYLAQQNRRNAGDTLPAGRDILAGGKHVIVIGGGDTGADCVGTAARQGAKSITQLEILPQPPETRPVDNPWPTWGRILRRSPAHDEGCERRWSLATREFRSDAGRVVAWRGVAVDWTTDAAGNPVMREAGQPFDLPADLVLLAMGFLHVDDNPLIRELDLARDARGNLVVNENGMTSEPGIFACGDTVLGASLVVRAFRSGQEAAAGVEGYLAALK